MYRSNADLDLLCLCFFLLELSGLLGLLPCLELGRLLRLLYFFALLGPFLILFLLLLFQQLGLASARASMSVCVFVSGRTRSCLKSRPSLHTRTRVTRTIEAMEQIGPYESNATVQATNTIFI